MKKLVVAMIALLCVPSALQCGATLAQLEAAAELKQENVLAEAVNARMQEFTDGKRLPEVDVMKGLMQAGFNTKQAGAIAQLICYIEESYRDNTSKKISKKHVRESSTAIETGIKKAKTTEQKTSTKARRK